MEDNPVRHWMLLGVLGTGFALTALATQHARIELLSTVEPYAFAVQHQILTHFASVGTFAQTIHLGYDDTWIWSGHRSVTFLLSGLILWAGAPPLALAAIQIVAVTLGAIPAALLGRAASGRSWGILVGGLMYLGSPPVMALAMQDYQDLVFALPFLMTALLAMRARSPWLLILGALVGCLPREECVPLVVACAFVTFDPRWERPFIRWIRNLALAGLVAVVYGGSLSWAFPLDASAHDMPLYEQLSSFTSGASVRLWGWPCLGGFYSLLWLPVGLLAILAPLELLPGLALLALHVTIPFHHGVDRHWGAHVHHMAPMTAFFLAATIVGICRLIRLLQHRRLGRWGKPLALGVGIVLAGSVLRWDLLWSRWFSLVPAWRLASTFERHPVWNLVDQLPDDAIPIVSSAVSLSVSDRLESYSFDESLLDKAWTRGMAAGTHLIVDRNNADILAWGMAMPGARVLAESAPYLLITWDAGAADPVLAGWTKVNRQRHPEWADAALDYRGRPGVAPEDPQPITNVPIRYGKIGNR